VTNETPAVRASDAERDRTVELLREHLASGRLTPEEFSERMEAAYEARTTEDLSVLSRDLPAAVPAGRRPKRLSGVVFGDVEVAGRWRMPRSKFVVVVFGNADIDLRGAELPAERATLRAFVLFGNVDVYVPESVDVDLGGLTVFGHRRASGEDRSAPGAPLLRVRVYGLFAAADLWHVPAELVSRSFREVTRTLGRRRRGELEA
jgi:hypothetical protein